jgi:radical SAM superfamily enzyme YgiQ (UPF0313 family)
MKVLMLSPRMPLSFLSFSKAMRRQGCKAPYPSLSLITVAALLPREWQLRLVDMNVEAVTEPMWDWADLVMISGLIMQRENMLALIREAKDRGKTVVAGGAYPSTMPEEVFQAGVDFLIKGEGENTIPLFLEALAERRPGGLIESDTWPDLADSPIPRYDLLNLKAYSVLCIQTSRGCPHDCEFCDVVQLYGRRTRYKEPHQVIAELETIYHLGWRGPVFVCDDNFIGNKTRTRALLKELILWSKSHGEPFVFQTQATVSLGEDVALIDLMTEANFAEVLLGIESPDKEALTISDKHHNRLASMEEAINRIKANGLSIVGSFILGMDGEKPGAGDRIISLIEATNIPLVLINLLQPIPSTRLWQRLKREGRLLEERFQEAPNFGTFGMGTFFIPNRPEEQVISEYLKVWTTAYEPRRFLERTYRYFLDMRPTRATTARLQGTPLSPTEAPKSLRQQLSDAYAFLSFSWQFGVVYPTRWQYWRQLLGIWRKNPSRVINYLSICGLGEDMFDYRDLACRRLSGTPE